MVWTSFASNPYGCLFEKTDNTAEHIGYNKVVIELPTEEAKELFVKLFNASMDDFEIHEDDPDEMHYGERVLTEEHNTMCEALGFIKGFDCTDKIKNQKVTEKTIQLYNPKSTYTMITKEYRVISQEEIRDE